MNESVKNPSESIGELFLMAYGGLDPEPALTMIRDTEFPDFILVMTMYLTEKRHKTFPGFFRKKIKRMVSSFLYYWV